MSLARRREQLVSIARDIIAAEGADALTLARLAQRAGVSKPVVYDHFASREALLLWLYEDFDERKTAEARDALEGAPAALDARLRALADTHIRCVLSQGLELRGVAAALLGDPDLELVRQRSDRRYLGICQRAIAASQDGAELDDAAAIAFLGAADAVSDAAARGDISSAQAQSTLVTLLRGLVQPASTDRSTRTSQDV